MTAAEMIEKALKENPDFRLILEAANRAREAESKEPPRNIGVATETAAVPISSQGPVLPETFG